MADVPTHRDLFLAGRREALIKPTRFDKALIDQEGSDVNIVFQVSAAMGEEVVRYALRAINGLALSTARGEALRRFVYDRYQLLPYEAHAAVVLLQVGRSDSSTGVAIPEGSAFGTDDGVAFRTVSDVVFPQGSLGPYMVVASAERTGPGGNVAAGTITRVLSALPDTTVTVTNPEPAAGGTDAETDDELRARGREFFTTARRGTHAAVEYGGTSTPGVAQATAVEVLSDQGIPVYRGQLYIADRAGQANTPLAQAVLRNLDEYRGLGVPVQVVPAVPQYVDIVATGLQFTAGANTAQVLDQAARALLAAVNGLAPGVTLRRATLLGELSRVDQLVVPDGALVTPAGDLVPMTGTAIRTTRDRITLSGATV